MSKITEYTSVNAFDSGDVLLKDGTNGTKIIPVESAASEFLRLGGQNDKNAQIETALTNFGSNLAGLEAEYVASKDYALGDFFMVENKLYKATEPISDGDTITPDTNCVETDISTGFKATKEIVDGLSEEIAKKANVDGYYSDLAAGTADQLMASQKVHNSDPYIFRTSGGTSDIGNREELEIVGGSIVWNQLVQNGDFADTLDSWSTTSATVSVDNSIPTINTIGSGAGGIVQNISPKIGHVILASAVIQNVDATTAMLRLNSNVDKPIDTSITWWQTVSNVVKYNSVDSSTIYIRIGNANQSLKVKSVNVFDLTQMFGFEIADHIYELEQATAGAGVAWFRKYFPNDYYDYNPGELMHVSDLHSHDTVGFNLFDVSQYLNLATNYDYVTNNYKTKKIRLLPNTTYYIRSNSGEAVTSPTILIHVKPAVNSTGFLDLRKASDTKLFTTGDDGLLYIGTYDGTNSTVNDRLLESNICINLSLSGTRDGEYEPYVKRSYPLDPSLTLRGVPKLTADGDLTYDGDVYKPDGTVERRYGIVDLGTLNWTYHSETAHFYVAISASKTTGANFLCSKYSYNGTADTSAMANKTTGLYRFGNMFRIKDTAYTDPATFKDAMSGVYLVYELAEPTTEEAEPYTNPQIVDDWGTEEFVTTSIVPVGHNTSYPANLRDKLQHLPDLPDDDGYYMTQVTGTQMNLVRFRIPQAPAEDGTYVLKATVTNGVPVYTWVDPDAVPETEEPVEP